MDLKFGIDMYILLDFILDMLIVWECAILGSCLYTFLESFGMMFGQAGNRKNIYMYKVPNNDFAPFWIIVTC